MGKNDPEMKINTEDLIVINAEEKEEEESMLANMETRRAKAKAEKAAKRAAKRKTNDAESTNGAPEAASSSKSAKSDKHMENGKSTNGKSFEKSTKTVLQNDPSKSEVFKSLFSSHK